jgi:putative addiction module component (TIGR02574 family)
MSRVAINEILDLPTVERVEIVQEIWESIVARPESVPVTAAQREELERRWKDLQDNPDDGEPWDDVKKSLLNE